MWMTVKDWCGAADFTRFQKNLGEKTLDSVD